jgi:transposase InsO family protein
VTARKAEGFAVTDACAAAAVSRSAYYDWLGADDGPSDEQWDEAADLNRIIDIHAASDGTYGQPRVTAQLALDGHRVNHKRVERLMREHGLQGHRPRRRRSLTEADTQAPPLPDLVGRDFDPDGLDVLWVGDITYIPTGEGWLYLATTIDLGSRRLLGWSMGRHHDTDLVVAALEHAVTSRGAPKRHDGGPRTIFHSDKGSEYTSGRFRQVCDRLGFAQSTGRTGSCLDNAAAESFFASLKVELVNRRTYATRAEARASIFAWIARYNHHRLHSSCGMLPPMTYEQQLTDTEDGPLPLATAA